ncbi:hypothetical protein MPTK1_8g11090 [Marchantia polymorpha subsp. ruderalis]|uniref:Uncharacterized protein n=1 Tax=Marchantia polymorpha TaxID=3197 RepID=A0A2R6XML5_MARPO|nr:hypothetical protein MARPO_0008s0111 [Marchantia polymorpha]BBN19488.1 hypothetical protein Mp_8g11090 [Marchantia polymorpha subsp. ruderalis]|eukprot:PTQ47340.1 hypothetical protein MARPO_0008s0111 [Marchantia polymorpha]
MPGAARSELKVGFDKPGIITSHFHLPVLRHFRAWKICTASSGGRFSSRSIQHHHQVSLARHQPEPRMQRPGVDDHRICERKLLFGARIVVSEPDGELLGGSEAAGCGGKLDPWPPVGQPSQRSGVASPRRPSAADKQLRSSILGRRRLAVLHPTARGSRNSAPALSRPRNHTLDQQHARQRRRRHRPARQRHPRPRRRTKGGRLAICGRPHFPALSFTSSSHPFRFSCSHTPYSIARIFIRHRVIVNIRPSMYVVGHCSPSYEDSVCTFSYMDRIYYRKRPLHTIQRIRIRMRFMYALS